MPSAETLERFIARVESNAHAEAIEEFYTEGASMRSECVRPVFVQGDRVVVRWIFEFEWLDGKRTRMEELAYQRWEGERIAEEQFFYDPAQLGG